MTGTDCSSGFMEVQRPSPTNSSQLVSVDIPIGSIRASLGYLSTFEDCYALVKFLEGTFMDQFHRPKKKVNSKHEEP